MQILRSRQQYKKSTAAAITLLLCFCFVTVVCSGFVVYNILGKNHFYCANSFFGASALQWICAGAVKPSGGQLTVLILVGVFGGAAFIALLLFYIVFPVINKIFNTRLPCVGMFNREYEDDEDFDVPTNETPQDEDLKLDTSILQDEVKSQYNTAFKKRADKTEMLGVQTQKTSEHGNRAVEQKRLPEKKRESVAASGLDSYENDRYVKTVRIDTLYNPTQENSISSTKIDQAMRAAANSPSAKGAPEKTAIKHENAPDQGTKKKDAPSLGITPKSKDATVKAKRSHENKTDIAINAKLPKKAGAAQRTSAKAEAAKQTLNMEMFLDASTYENQNNENSRALKKKSPIASIQAHTANGVNQNTDERTQAERLSYLEKKLQESVINEDKNSIKKK